MYKIWEVITTTELGSTKAFYIINIETRKVQSVWGLYTEASDVCKTLNRMAS